MAAREEGYLCANLINRHFHALHDRVSCIPSHGARRITPGKAHTSALSQQDEYSYWAVRILSRSGHGWPNHGSGWLNTNQSPTQTYHHVSTPETADMVRKGRYHLMRASLVGALGTRQVLNTPPDLAPARHRRSLTPPAPCQPQMLVPLIDVSVPSDMTTRL